MENKHTNCHFASFCFWPLSVCRADTIGIWCHLQFHNESPSCLTRCLTWIRLSSRVACTHELMNERTFAPNCSTALLTLGNRLLYRVFNLQNTFLFTRYTTIHIFDNSCERLRICVLNVFTANQSTNTTAHHPSATLLYSYALDSVNVYRLFQQLSVRRGLFPPFQKMLAKVSLTQQL